MVNKMKDESDKKLINILDKDFIYLNPLIKKYINLVSPIENNDTYVVSTIESSTSSITSDTDKSKFECLDLSKGLKFYFDIGYEPYRFSHYILSRLSACLIYNELFSITPKEHYGDFEELDNILSNTSNNKIDVLFYFEVEGNKKLIFNYYIY